jgi:hypothetical protein
VVDRLRSSAQSPDQIRWNANPAKFGTQGVALG